MGNIVRRKVFVLLTVISRVVNGDANDLCIGEILFEHGFGIAAKGNVHAVVPNIYKSSVSVVDTELFKAVYKCGGMRFLFFKKNVINTYDRSEIFEHAMVLK